MKYSHKMFFISKVLFFVFIAGSFTLNTAAGEKDLTFFAAASTTNAVTEIVKLYKKEGRGNIMTSFASSSTLAKQIANGAPADIYLSANTKWMDYLEEKGDIQKQSRFNLLSNHIALIVPAQSPVGDISINKDLDISSLLGKDGRMAIGDPEHVPAGMYGKKALENLGLWKQVKGRIAPMKDVRAALVLVERAETPLGLVYTTDAAVTDKVRIIGVFPDDCHPPIVYPIAIIKKENYEAAMSFLNFLKTPDARAIFVKYGFEVL